MKMLNGTYFFPHGLHKLGTRFFYDNAVRNKWVLFKNKLLFLIHNYIPKKTFRHKKSAPWFNNVLKKFSRKKKSLYNHQRKTNSPRDKNGYFNSCLFPSDKFNWKKSTMKKRSLLQIKTNR